MYDLKGIEFAPGLIGRSLILEYVIAAHQLDSPRIFTDPLSQRVVDVRSDLTSFTHVDPTSPPDKYLDMRLLMVMCHRFADDIIVAGIKSGIRQLLILDAGLDMTCYRRQYPNMRLFEVNLEPIQVWKRRRLADIGIRPSPALSYIPISDDHDMYHADIERFGYKFDEPSLIIWLDHAVFQPEHVLFDTVRWLDMHTNRVQIVFNYVQNPGTLDGQTLENVAPLQALMKAAGHPPISFVSPTQLMTELHSHEFDRIENLGWRDLLARYVPDRAEVDDPVAGHVVHAIRSRAKSLNRTCQPT